VHSAIIPFSINTLALVFERSIAPHRTPVIQLQRQGQATLGFEKRRHRNRLLRLFSLLQKAVIAAEAVEPDPSWGLLQRAASRHASRRLQGMKWLDFDQLGFFGLAKEVTRHAWKAAREAGVRCL